VVPVVPKPKKAHKLPGKVEEPLMDTKNSLHPLFYPRGIAVVGASRKTNSIGHKILRSLLEGGYHGPVHPINPKAEPIDNKVSYPSVCAAPAPIDLAVIAVPADSVVAIVDDCAKAGVKALVVISAGFGETGSQGAAMEAELLAKVRANGMRMVGPNCFGILNTDPQSSINACFSSVFGFPGGIAMASQSGAMGLAILNMARQHQVGLSMFVSMGNKADVSSNDLIEYWEQDERTKAILLYLESFGNPTKFSQLARRVGRHKPIIALKSGRSSAGARAAGSHTAALAANDVAVDALFRQSGVLRVDSVEEMFHLSMAVDTQPMPEGNRIGILTNAGGPAILCADACEAAGLVIPEFPLDTQNKLRQFIPAAASSKNPVDLVASASPELIGRAIEIALAASEVDALIVIFAVIDGIPNGLKASIGKAVSNSRALGIKKPVYVCLMEGENIHPPLKAGTESIPIFRFPEEPAKALGRLFAYSCWKAKPFVQTQPTAMVFEADFRKKLRDLSPQTSDSGSRWLSSEAIQLVFRQAGISFLQTVDVSSSEAAVQKASELGYPVAMKVRSSQLTHKTDIGGVLLGLANAAAVEKAFGTIEKNLAVHAPQVPFEGVSLQPMAPKGLELFVGMVRDAKFGPLIGFGLGGIFVEVLRDLAFRLAPLNESEARDMLAEIKARKLLMGYRGQPAVDQESLVGLLQKISQLSIALPEIVSLDLNPVLALPGQGYLVLDARIQT
jgi:acetate---CoA ligase (ADP-forming)